VRLGGSHWTAQGLKLLGCSCPLYARKKKQRGHYDLTQILPSKSLNKALQMTKLKIMISSRCRTKIVDGDQTAPLSEIRKELKREMEAEMLLGEPLYEVWISEEPDDASAKESSWQECMNKAESSDILLCIYTGEGGWAKKDGDIGICHAELEASINKERNKVYIINAKDACKTKPSSKSLVNIGMRKYVERIDRFQRSVTTKSELLDACLAITANATIQLAKMGKREAKRDKYNFGEALDWSRMNFMERKAAIENEISDQFSQSGMSTADGCVNFERQSKTYLLKIHGIPSGMNISSAREMVGQPFLKDHLIVSESSTDSLGPIHLIGVHKGVTEQQTIAVLGQPDAVIVDGPFGIYIADKIQNIQMVFLSNCRDSASSRHNVQKFLSWIDESGESDSLFLRAERRSQLMNIINEQQESG